MEILIIGIIIVALMAFASTKIKKAASEAYKEELLQNDYFTITKPDGFMIPVKEYSEFMFEAYSKEFAEDEADKFNQCWAVVNEKDGVDHNTAVLETEQIINEVTIIKFNKILVSEALNKSFELEVSVIPEYKEKFSAGIKLMLESFLLK